MKRVSVIIINYNTFELTRKAVSSIYKKSGDQGLKVILVDNGSDERDPSPLKEEFSELKLIKSGTNLGFAGGVNLALDSCSEEYILLMNSDAEQINNAVGICAKYLDEHPDTAIVSARLEYPDGSHQPVCQRFPSLRYRLTELFRLQKLWSKKKMEERMLGAWFEHNREVEPDWVWGSFFMFRSSVLDSLPNRKLYAKSFMYGEDMQWCMDFRNLGWKVGFVPEARVQHVMEASGGKKSELMRAAYQRFLRENYGVINAWMIQTIDKLL